MSTSHEHDRRKYPFSQSRIHELQAGTRRAGGAAHAWLATDMGQDVEKPRELAQERIRVLQLINGESYAGAERVQDLLSLRLPDQQVDVGIACVKPREFEARRQSRDTPLHAIPMRSRFDLRVVSRIAALIRDCNYQVLHTHGIRNAMVGRPAAERAGVPWVHHVHSPARQETTDRLRNRINAFVDEHYIMPAADRLITVSDSLRDYVVAHGADPEKVRVVPNGVPTPEPLRHWAPPFGQWTVGVVALFRPRKGLEVLIEALAALRSHDAPVSLLVVGNFESVEHEAKVHALVRSRRLEDHVRFQPFTADVAGQMRRMDIFALPSLFGEGMPMVVLEAMAMGLPVIGSAIEGVPEVLGRGEAGLLVPANDPLALATAIDSLVRDPQRAAALARTGQRRQQLHYSDHAMAGAIAGIYRDVLDAQRRRRAVR